jgi:hypothetical protein
MTRAYPSQTWFAPRLRSAHMPPHLVALLADPAQRARPPPRRLKSSPAHYSYNISLAERLLHRLIPLRQPRIIHGLRNNRTGQSGRGRQFGHREDRTHGRTGPGDSRVRGGGGSGKPGAHSRLLLRRQPGEQLGDAAFGLLRVLLLSFPMSGGTQRRAARRSGRLPRCARQAATSTAD